METYLQQISNHEQQNATQEVQIKKSQQKEVNILKKELEKITKNFNTISSQNQKKRSEISTLRKERTLYDHLFKTLEYQILHQEKDLLDYIQRNEKEENQIVQIEKNLQDIQKLVKQNTYAEFYKIIEQEKQKYLQEISEPYKQKNLQHRLTQNCIQHNPTQKQLVTIKTQDQNNSQKQQEDENNSIKILQNMDIESKLQDILVVDQTLAEFKYYTEGLDIEFIQNFMKNGQKINDQLYTHFCKLENQLQQLQQESNMIQSQVQDQSQQNQMIDQKIENIQKSKFENLETQFNSQQKKLNKTLVFQKVDFLNYGQYIK